MATGNQSLLNKGRRRLGRFPIPSSSTILKKSDDALKDCKILQHKSKEKTQASYLTSFSASNDDTLLMEVEEMEAAMGAQKDDMIRSADLADPLLKQTEAKHKNFTLCIDKSASQKLPYSELKTKVCSKRSHMQSQLFVQGYKKSFAQGVQFNTTEASKAVASKNKLGTPTSSPLDKRQRRISKVLPVKKKTAISLDLKDSHVNNKNQQAQANFESPLKQAGISFENVHNNMEISYSPLVSSPHSPSSICNITTEESPPSTSRSSVGKASCFGNGRNLSPKKNITAGIKSVVKTPSKVKKSLDIISLQKEVKDASKISTTPKRPTRACVKTRSNLDNLNSSENVSFKKAEEKSEPGKLNFVKHESKVAGSVRKEKKPSAKHVSSINKNHEASLHSSTVGAKAGSNIDPSASLQSSAAQSFDVSHIVGYSNRTKNHSPVANVSVSEDKRQLDQWGLPEPVLEAYKHQGVTTMFEWQAECLLSDNVLDGGNLVFSAPTSAGKTLVAELLVLKRVVETRKKALFVLPFVSVAREKMYALQRLYQDAGIRVGGYMGSHNPPGGLSQLDVAVCTIEKGNGIINRLMEDDKLCDLGVMVVDELHMVGDSHRGYLLELMLTKLAFITHKAKTQNDESPHKIQLIGMSATLPNLSLLAKWLDAALFCTDFRPVPLTEHIKVDNRILDQDLEVQRELPASLVAVAPEDADHVIALCLETVNDGNAVLIFCPTKNWCEKLCETIAKKFHSLKHLQKPEKNNDDLQQKGETREESSFSWNLNLDRFKLAETVEQLRRCIVGVDPMLNRCILNGVAYHHAGLTFEERDIIEGAFRQGQIKVLIATSTLSSGVNLPARRVIVRTPMFHGHIIDTLTYKQMAGRAGRKGVDTQGESILICKPQEKLKGKNLLQAELPPVESCLHFDPGEGLSRSLKRAVLEVVVSGVAPSPEDVMTYVNCTLLSASLNCDSSCENSNSLLIDSCIQFLQDNEFVTVQKSKNDDGVEVSHFHPTLLGSAILASSLSPDEGLAVFAELQKARRAFVLDTDLHIIYLVTPMYASDMSSSSLDWCHYYALWEALTPADRRVAEMVGVSEAFIARAVNGRRINTKSEAQKRQLSVHLRFHTSLILYDLVREVPLIEVAHKFNYNKGQLQSLQQSAATYAGMITVLCGRLGWHSLELLLSSFQHRLSSGVQPELVDLVRVSSLSATSARMLYNAGYSTVALLARAKPVDLENVFRSSVPFQSDKQQEGETEWEARERQRARCIWLTGRKGVTELEAAEAIIQEAKDIVQGDLGGAAITWESEEEGEEEGESKSGEDHSSQTIVSQEDKENQTIDKFSKQALTKPSTVKAETSGDSRDQPNLITSDRLRKKGSHLKENKDTNLQEKVSEKNSLNNPATDSPNLDSKTVVEKNEEENSVCREEKRVHLHHSHTRPVRRRSSKSFNLSSNNSSLNQSHILSSANKSNRKVLFGQTVLSPPVGIVRGASKLCSEGQITELSAARTGPQCVLTFDAATNGKSTGPSKRLNSDRDLSILTLPSMEKIHTDIGSCGDSVSEMQCEKRVEMNPETYSAKVENGREPSCMNENHGYHAIKKNANDFPIQDNPSHTPSRETSNPLKTPAVSTPLSITQNDFLFSASFDLDTQAAQLLDSCYKSQNDHDKSKTLKQSVPDLEAVKKQPRSAGSNDNTNQMNANIAKSDSFDDSLSEVLFGEVDKVAKADEVVKDQHNKSTKKKVYPFQCQDDEAEISIGGGAENQNLDTSMEAAMISEEEAEEQEESSLIAASNRFEHFDDCIIEDESLDSSHVSFTKLKTKSPEKTAQSESVGRKSVSNAVTSDGRAVLSQAKSLESLNEIQTEEDENLLLAALDQSLSFNTSPMFSLGQSHTEKVPQNSTPVDSFTNVLASSNLAAQLSTNTPKSHFSSSSRNLQQRRMLSNGVLGLTSTFKATHSNQAASQTSEDYFTDSFSLTLMDKMMNECDNLQASKKTCWEKTSSDHSGTGITKNTEGMAELQSLPELCCRKEPVSENNPESANSSRHDGSDCVPPTPPDLTTSHTSPMKMSFYSPLKPKLPKEDSKIKADDNSFPSTHKKSDKRKEKLFPKKSTFHKMSKMDFQESARDLRKSSNSTTEGFGQCNKQLVAESSNRDPCLIHPLQSTEQPKTPPPQSLNTSISSHPHLIPPSQNISQLTQQSFSIIDVCADRRLFDSFIIEWQAQTSFSLSLACEKLPPQGEKPAALASVIGQRFTKKKPAAVEAPDRSHVTGIKIPDSKQMVVGLAISWENRDVYFVSLMPTGYVAACDPDDSLSEPSLDNNLTQKERVLAITNILSSKQREKSHRLIAYDAKAVYITLAKTFGISLPTCEDPRVADWIQAPTSRLKNLHHMVASFCPEELPLLEAVGGASSYGSIGLDMALGSVSQTSGRLRACTESVLARVLMDQYYVAKLAEEDLLEAFTEVEMPSLLTLARMELNGFGVSEAELESQKNLMTTKLTALEEQAYEMAGHVFSLTSTDDISKILYSELKLPINGDPSLMPQLSDGRGQRRGRNRTALIGSTSKETLEKLTKFHPLPAVVLEWRRISSALTKSLFALQRTAKLCLRLNMPRVFGDCQIFTATGRISMAEPNIQNIPKDFAIELPDYIGESPTASQPASRVGKKGSKLAAIRGDKLQTARIMDPDNVITAPVSMRKIFVPFKGGVLLAADYSQLELRVIAHLSGDSKLAAVLNAKDGDVFKMIAAQMHSIEVEGVTPAQRQQAKQVCYGMLYGIGAKALGEQLGVDENDAGAFMEMFKARYPACPISSAESISRQQSISATTCLVFLSCV
ncbi:DNA polymerase theta-like, partial [Elysia marginata]